MNPSELKQWRADLGLGETGAAALLGIPVHTLRKWENGTRKPDAAPRRLMVLLQRVQADAPELHQALVTEAVGKPSADPVEAPKRRGKGKVASEPENAPQGPPASPAPPPPWLAAADALPAWMTAAASL